MAFSPAPSGLPSSVSVIPAIAERYAELVAWRRDLHAHPELAYAEKRTSRVVAERLASFGLDPDVGLAGTGVVATIHGDAPGPGIALRADLDALPMHEENRFGHASTHPGRMHACGHDGHTTMLLAAARHLAETRRFAGTVHVVFQPAEEGGAGGKLMVDQGLFDRFPAEQVFGMHNWPALPTGQMAVHTGPAMAAVDIFKIAIEGRGGHAAMPHQTRDPIVGGAQLVTALQTLVSRTVDPTDPAVVSVTAFNGGTAHNVIPPRVELMGTVRSFSAAARDTLESGIERLTHHICTGLGLTGAVDYQREYPATVNTAAEADLCAAVAAQVVGAENVQRDLPPSMGAEDFAFMLQARPGCYVWLGTGVGPDTAPLHHPRFDFHDAALPLGASYWVRLVETRLPRERRG